MTTTKSAPAAENGEGADHDNESHSHNTSPVSPRSSKGIQDGLDGLDGLDQSHAHGEISSSADADAGFSEGVGGSAHPIEPIQPTHLTAPAPRALTPEHTAELARSAVSADVALSHGVYSALMREDLPEWAQWVVDIHGEKTLPALVYPMEELDGSPTGQVKPQSGTVSIDGRVLKYVSPSDKGGRPFAPRLPVVRRVKKKKKGVLIVEGVKQALAVAAYADKGWLVLRICGISSWLRQGLPPKELKVVRDLPVVIVPDADASANLRVYEGAGQLGDACTAKGAASVSYVRLLGAGGTAGIDDVLGDADQEDRAGDLARLVASARPKPADRKPSRPTASERKEKEAAERARDRDSELKRTRRPLIHVEDDRHAVITSVKAALKDRFDGTELFAHGGGLAALVQESHGSALVPLREGERAGLIARCALTVEGVAAGDKGKPCSHKAAWPDKNTMAAISAAHRDFTPVEGISHVPLVRGDGSIVTSDGYDRASRHVVKLSSDLVGLQVPENPSAPEVEAARDLLLVDLLGDFLLPTETDRAHALAALLTPVVRALMPAAPFFVINGLQPGVGKGKLLGCFYAIVSGRPAALERLPEYEDEVRKTITASLHGGSTLLAFDEVASLKSPSLNALVTAESWSDRKLGVSERIEMPNRATLFFAGNNIAISGDATRRALPIRLSTDLPNPESRSGFRHELPDWALASRRELLSAALTLVRAWYARGCPSAPQPFRFGSFERWQEIIGGILHVADVPGFLLGVREEQRASDYYTMYWGAHLQWLLQVMGQRVFTALEVSRDAKKGGPVVEMPPDLEVDVAPRELGKAYAKVADRWFDGVRLVKVGTASGGSLKWRLEVSPPGGGSSSTPASATPAAPAAPSASSGGPQAYMMQPVSKPLACEPVVTEREEDAL